MVFLVPFDGSPAAEAALGRAVEHGRALERRVLAVSYVPTGTAVAERRTWIEPAEDFAAESASSVLRRKIEEATDETELTYEDTGAGSPADGIADAVRQTATDVDASVLFVGLANGTGEALQTRFGAISASADYDVHIVRDT